jgi:hypothetical protein
MQSSSKSSITMIVKFQSLLAAPVVVVVASFGKAQATTFSPGSRLLGPQIGLGGAGRCWQMLADAGRCWQMLADAGRCWQMLASTPVPFLFDRADLSKSKSTAYFMPPLLQRMITLCHQCHVGRLGQHYR